MSTSQRVFVTGISGYIGGHVVARIMEQHPEWNIAALVRTKEQKEIVLKRWPSIEAVIGDLDDKELLISEALKSDVVLRK
jgi:nucleoside-diphosphate-sugar epimerase